jgi:hypothetical protein
MSQENVEIVKDFTRSFEDGEPHEWVPRYFDPERSASIGRSRKSRPLVARKR